MKQTAIEWFVEQLEKHRIIKRDQWTTYFDIKSTYEKLIEQAKELEKLANENNNTSEVTRFEVIDKTGRVYSKWDCSIELSYQDNGKTLKVFVDGIGNN